MIRVTVKGSYQKTEKFLTKLQRNEHLKSLDKFGPIGVAALSSATPKDSSETANSWYYETVQKKGYYAIVWRNSHVEKSVPIAVILQYGHGTKTGGFVEGRDYINPAMQSIFDQIVAEMWKVVTK